MFKRLFSLALRECIRQQAKLIISAMLMIIMVTALLTTLNIHFSLSADISASTGENTTSSGTQKVSQQRSGANKAAGSVRPAISKNEMSMYGNILKLVDTLTAAILVFIALILYISTANIMLNDKKQLALYKIIGFDNAKMVWIMLWEGLLISLPGFILALPVAYLINQTVIALILKSNQLMDFNIAFKPLSGAIALLVVLIAVLTVTILLYFKIRKVYPVSLVNKD